MEFCHGKRCHTFRNRNIVLLPILLGKMSCVPKPTLCELYVVKVLGRIGQKLMELSCISQMMSMCFIFGVPSWLYTILHSVLWRVLQNLKCVLHLYIGRVCMLIKSCWVGLHTEHARDVTITTIGIPGIHNSRNSGIPVSLHSLYGYRFVG